MNKKLLILLLVLVLESRGKLIPNKPYDSRTSTNLTRNEDRTLNNHARSEPTRQDDEEPVESSETVAYNKIQEPLEDEEDQSDEEEQPEGPPDHAIPYSEHEEPRNISTKPKYVGPGEWAKPPKDRDVPSDFVPSKVYAQVRKTHTVRRLPRKKAIENAESEEEKENAARLREVVRNSKVNTVYTEEGYEDSAYDHAGHVRDADFEEAYARKLQERLDHRKKSGVEDDDEEEVTEQSNLKTKIDPEEFEDYEDYEDRRADSNVVSERNERKEPYPKVFAEEGIEKLQEDVEKEVEEIERGVGIDKLESGEQRRKTKKRRRPVSSKKSKINGEQLEESRKIKNVEDYSTTAPVEATTLREKFENSVNPYVDYNYETRENSPQVDFRRTEEAPTTISYSQLFWDYFKTMQIEPTTIQPSTLLESTTESPNFLQASSILGNVNTLAPYSLYGQETTTPFPVADSTIFGAKTVAPGQFDLKKTDVGHVWQPIIYSEPATTIDDQFLGTYDDKILNNDQGIPFSNLVKNLDSKEESDGNLDSSLFNSPLNLLANRRPRYKIAVRQKPKKPAEHFNKKSSTLSPVNESTTTKSIPFHENYMKVLMHLKNQEKAKNLRHPNSLQPNNFYSSININNPKDPRRLRSPVPQKTSDYYNVPPRRSKENFVGSEKSRQARINSRAPQTHSDFSRNIKKSSRNLIPALDLLPPSPVLQNFARPKETADYLTGNGQVRNLYRPFRRAGSFEPIAGIRAKRRERRSPDDGGGGDVKGSMANNHASNRVGIERPAKNSSIERNSRLNANGELQVALVPDTSAEKPTDEKKSRSFREGRVAERESRDHEGIRDDSKSLKYNDDEWKRKGKEESTVEVQLNKNHEDLLNESPKVTNDVIQKEIEARFNGKEEEDEESEDLQDDIEVEVPDFDYVEELPEENVTESQTTEPSMDLQKYPFYKDERIPTPSALKYAIDPERLPKKTYGGMEFYGSRDAYKHCEEVEPSLKVLPENEEPVPERGPEENLPRLRGLGDKLDCFKAKYFDNDPFDNPLFQEREVEDPRPPEELDAKRFASRIMLFPKQSDDYVIQKSSKRPENYRRPRKPSSNAARVQKSGRVLYRSYPGSGRGTRPRLYRVQGVRVKYTKGSRRPQKIIRRPVASASDVWSLYTPYQSQVYEDVMGTIRNMANSYQVHEVTTVPTSDEITVVSDTIDDVKTNVSVNSTTFGKKKKHNETTHIVERPNKVDSNIQGLIPPKYYDRFQSSYRRNRTPQKNKTRVQRPRNPTSVSRSNRRQKVRVYKRDLRNKRDADEETPQNSEEDDNKRMSESPVNATSTRDTVSKLIDANRKFKVPKSASESINGDRKKEKSEKVVYTIKDRIRYSKPKGDVIRVGKFVNETEVQEDKRRKEPKYNYIKRRGPLNLASSTTETPFSDSTEEINWTESSISTVTLVNEDAEETNKEFAKENQEDIRNQSQNATKKIEQDQIARSNAEPVNETGNGYAVYENVKENEESTTQQPHPATSSEFFNLKSFLDTNPPGYVDMSSEEFKKSLFSNKNSSNDFKFDSDSTNAKEIGNKESDDEDNVSFNHQSNEDSSEKLETSTESSGESDSKESDSEERSTFFRYESRPSSPAENYEDEKYAELGPRVNKPAFFHPPFSFSRTSRLRGSSEEAEESTEEKAEYVFPWYRDKENERKKKRQRNRGNSMGEYEYPWERRERLAREEKKRRRGLSKTFDDDEDTEETFLNHRRLYPRGKYRFWSHRNEDASEERTSDAVGSSSEQRPVGKYSSKYNSKSTKLPINKKTTDSKRRGLEEISRSIKRALEGDSDEKRNNFSQKNRGISRGIVPEDVTLEPIGRNKKKNSSSDVTESDRRNSTESSKSVSVDSGPQTTVLKANVEGGTNSTQRSNKKRRRPTKSTVSNVESTPKIVEDSNRTRRRQKSGSTTPATITSTSATSTTSASRVVRRRYQKSVKDSKRIGTVKAVNRSDNDVNNRTETSTSRSRALGHRSNSEKETTEENKRLTDQVNKNEKLQGTLIENFDEMKNLDKSNSEQGNNLENENINKKTGDDELEKDEEIERLNQKIDSVKSDEKFDFKDDRIDILSDFGKSDDVSDDDFGSILKTAADFTPKNRAVQLSEQESREVVSSVSWISENYNF